MPVERMRMRPWLEEQINSCKIPGLKWVNKVSSLSEVWKAKLRFQSAMTIEGLLCFKYQPQNKHALQHSILQLFMLQPATVEAVPDLFLTLGWCDESASLNWSFWHNMCLDIVDCCWVHVGRPVIKLCLPVLFYLLFIVVLSLGVDAGEKDISDPMDACSSPWLGRRERCSTLQELGHSHRYRLRPSGQACTQKTTKQHRWQSNTDVFPSATHHR